MRNAARRRRADQELSELGPLVARSGRVRPFDEVANETAASQITSVRVTKV